MSWNPCCTNPCSGADLQVDFPNTNAKRVRALEALRRFFRMEAASGILLVIAAVIAMVLANSPGRSLYEALLTIPVAVQVGGFHIAKPLLLWINDGLMAVFFFLVGLEIKREVLTGHLRKPAQILLPGVAAIGGMLIPALIYIGLNRNDPAALEGWAIPTATDIAFAMGVLALLGKRVPPALATFLLTLAVLDDLGAIIIIALFYSANLKFVSLAWAATAILVLFVLNRTGVMRFAPYLLAGIVLWVSVLKSGVHATLAGVVFALFIPLRDPHNPERSPSRTIEHDLHPWVVFGILPLFAFANAGVSLDGVAWSDIVGNVPLGIALGLFLGKQIGVFTFTWMAVKSGVARLPDGTDWLMVYGVSVLCGIGFTMSLFIASLAFEQTGVHNVVGDRLGILIGSLCAAVVGYSVLRVALTRKPLA